MLKQIFFLIKHDLLIEAGNRKLSGMMLLYMASTVFIAYYTFNHISDIRIWNGLFWLASLFSVSMAVTSSFTGVSKEKFYYFYTLVSPQAMILAKIIYNTIYIMLLSAVNMFIFVVLFNISPPSLIWYIPVNMAGISALAITLTMISGIASQGANNNYFLIPVLGFPVILPLLISIYRADEMIFTGNFQQLPLYLGIIVFFNLIAVLLAYILYPYLWKE